MAKEDSAAAGTEEGGGKKKLFMIIGAAVAAAVILGAVAFMLMGKGEKKEGGKAEAKVEGGHGASGEAGGASKMLALEPFIVNIYDGQELRYLKVKVEMEMSLPVPKAEQDERLAPIRDAILVLLSAKTLHDIQDAQGKNQLKDEILVTVNKLIPTGKVVKVYFTDFVVQ
jgi:flagellar FliL protein